MCSQIFITALPKVLKNQRRPNKKEKTMKKILATALALSVVFATRAQEIPERKHDGYKPHGEKGMRHRRPGGLDFKQLNLTEAQKEYAASDVLYLHQLKAELEARLKREGRLDLALRCFAFLPTRAEMDLLGWGDENDIFHH